MARKHIFILVVILGAAALSGLVAMARTSGVGAPATAAPAANPALDARLRQLTRFEKHLRKQLAEKPAKHAAAPRHAAVATSSSAGQSGTIYVPAASTSVQSSHSSFSDDEHEEEHEDEGGDD